MSTESPTPSPSSADFVCVGVQRKDRLLLLASVANKPAEQRSAALPIESKRTRDKGSARVFTVVASLTRAVAILFWLFPLLLIPKIVLWLLDSRIGDWITVAFVALAVLLFSLVSVVVLLHAVVGPRSRRQLQLALDEAPPSIDDALAWLQRDPVVATTAALLRKRLTSDGLASDDRHAPLRLRGRLGGATAAAREGKVLLRDSFRSTLPLARLTRARGFLFWPAGEGGDEDDSRPPLLVELFEPPTLLARYDKAPEHDEPELGERFVADYDAWSKSLDRQGRRLEHLFNGPTCLLRDGQDVELIAFDVEPVEDLAEARLAGRPLELDQDRKNAGPYRGAARQRSLRLSSTAQSPLIFRPRA